MSGTKYAPATLSRAEQARIQTALEEAARVSETIARAAAASTACRIALDRLDARAREQLREVVTRAEESRRAVDRVGEDLAREVRLAQDALNQALQARRARALPAHGDSIRTAAGGLEDQALALEAQTLQIGQLAESLAASAVSVERHQSWRQKARLSSLVDHLKSRLATDPSFQWVAEDVRRAIDDAGHRLAGTLTEDDCALVEQQLAQLRARAFEAERVYHERRRTAELVRTLFADCGYEVLDVHEPPHGSTDDIAGSFRPTEEHVQVSIAVRHPWGRDEERRQLLHLSMTARSASEQSNDPLCVDRLRDFALRARELGIEVGDVLQPLPGGGYECVLSSESLAAEPTATASTRSARERSI